MLEREPGRDGGVEAGARGAAVSRPEEDEADRIASIQQL
jgi:hypothetical protein